MHSRRQFTRDILGLSLLMQAWYPVPARTAENYPNRAVRLISFIPTASSADTTLRAMLVEVSREAGETFFVENRPGGSGSVAAAAVRSAPPDGYTLLVGGSSVLISALMRDRQQEPFVGFTPITVFLATRTALAVRNSLKTRTLAELVQMARDRPGQVSYATAGVGSYAHLMMELLARRAGVEFLHVPYPQLSSALLDAAADRVDCVFSTMGTMQPQVDANILHFVGITGSKRSGTAPDLPTFVEQGYPALSVDAWNGLFAPAGTSADILVQVAAAFARATQFPEVQKAARFAGIDTATSTPTEFRVMLEQEVSYWLSVMDETGIKLT